MKEGILKLHFERDSISMILGMTLLQKGPLNSHEAIEGVMLERSEASWVGWITVFSPFCTLVRYMNTCGGEGLMTGNSQPEE
jgi:hypothetical protein